MLIIYCICLFDGYFGSGVWQCWNCRVPFFLLGWRGTPEEGGIGPGCCGGGVITTWAVGDGVIAAGPAV